MDGFVWFIFLSLRLIITFHVLFESILKFDAVCFMFYPTVNFDFVDWNSYFVFSPVHTRLKIYIVVYDGIVYCVGFQF